MMTAAVVSPFATLKLPLDGSVLGWDRIVGFVALGEGDAACGNTGDHQDDESDLEVLFHFLLLY